MIQSRLLAGIPALVHAFTVKDDRKRSRTVPVTVPVQTHGATVSFISDPDSTRQIMADGLMTDSKLFSVGVVTADCVPILLYDPITGLKAALHAGWKGTLHSILYNAAQLMARQGADISDVIAAIGPAIKSCCYSIDEKRTQLFKNKFGTKSLIKINRKSYIDLQEINRTQLLECGLLEHNIDTICECTSCNADRYYSYRRGDRDKRMISFI